VLAGYHLWWVFLFINFCHFDLIPIIIHNGMTSWEPEICLKIYKSKENKIEIKQIK